MTIQRLETKHTAFGRVILAAIFTIACGCSADENNDSTPNQNTACIADSETGECAPKDLASVHLTSMQVNYDLTKPVYVNNRVPVQFGLTAKKALEGDADQRDIAVSFSFIEANPEDPKAPVECASNAIIVPLDFDGKEHQFAGVVWPTTLCQELVGKQTGLRVRFADGASEDAEKQTLSAPTITLTDAQNDTLLNQLCQLNDSDGKATSKGCGVSIDIKPTPTSGNGTLIDVLYADLEPESSVAVLPLPPNEEEAMPATLTVQSTFVVNGRDPYITGARPEDVPDELEKNEPGITEDLRFGLDLEDIDAFTKLPGTLTVRYEIAPANAPDDALALTISDPSDEEGDAHVESVTVDELLPGTPNNYTHELYAEGDTRKAIESGRWANETSFIVRGCFESSFEQSGNTGYKTEQNDCKVIPVMLMREMPSESAASSFNFNKSFNKGVGKRSRFYAGASLETSNTLDVNGLRSNVEGRLKLEGKLGRKFTLDIVRAAGNARLNTSGVGSNYEMSVDVFNQRVFSVADSVPDTYTREKNFSVGKSFPLPNLGFGFGPVRVGIQVKVGGEVSFNTADELVVLSDDADCKDKLNTGDSFVGCGSMSRLAGPGFNFTVDIDGGINLRLVKAGVRANLKLAEITMPLSGILSFGLTDDDKVKVRGLVTWKTVFRLISGKVSIYGKVGFRRFARRLTVNLFSFSSKKLQRTLLKRTTSGFKELQ